jgi:hypothetical protein
MATYVKCASNKKPNSTQNSTRYIIEVPNRPHDNAVGMLNILVAGAPLVAQDHLQSHTTNRMFHLPLCACSLFDRLDWY